jgi:hypothetical protein
LSIRQPALAAFAAAPLDWRIDRLWHERCHLLTIACQRDLLSRLERV